jgi:uncharacterized protein (DUF1778 family)
MTDTIAINRPARAAPNRSLKRTRALKSEHMQLRVHADLKLLVSEVAEMIGTSVSEFSTRVLRQAAEDEILNRRLVTLRSSDFDRFLAAVEHPAPLSDDVKARLRRKPVWEPA